MHIVHLGSHPDLTRAFTLTDDVGDLPRGDDHHGGSNEELATTRAA